MKTGKAQGNSQLSSRWSETVAEPRSSPKSKPELASEPKPKPNWPLYTLGVIMALLLGIQGIWAHTESSRDYVAAIRALEKGDKNEALALLESAARRQCPTSPVPQAAINKLLTLGSTADSINDIENALMAYQAARRAGREPSNKIRQAIASLDKTKRASTRRAAQTMELRIAHLETRLAELGPWASPVGENTTTNNNNTAAPATQYEASVSSTDTTAPHTTNNMLNIFAILGIAMSTVALINKAPEQHSPPHATRITSSVCRNTDQTN